MKFSMLSQPPMAAPYHHVRSHTPTLTDTTYSEHHIFAICIYDALYACVSIEKWRCGCYHADVPVPWLWGIL